MADNEPIKPTKVRVTQTKSPIRKERWEVVAKKPPAEKPVDQTDQFTEEIPEEEAPMEDFEQKVEAKTEEGLPPRQQQNQQQAQQQAMPQMPSFPSTSRTAPFSGTKGEEKDIEKEETPKGKGRVRIPKIPEGVKSVAKDVGSNAGIAFKKTSSRVASAASRGIGSGIGSAGRLASRLGNFGINFGSNFSSQFARRPFVTGMSKKYLLLLLLFMAFVLVFLTGAGPLPPPPPPTGGINMCLFTRGDRSPAEEKYQSPLLLSYFQEASGLTQVPTKVLAAFIRVESPSLTSYTDTQVQGYTCAESPTGALGVMQLQPAGTTGYCADCIANGARLLGLDPSTLTKADYCDVRKNIIMGTGWILKKMSFLTYGNGTKWDPAWTDNKDAIYALVNGYYGCILYPSCSSGPYSYGDDVWKGVQACTTATSGCTPPPAGDLKQSIINNFSITMNGFSDTQLGWAWNKLSCLSGTNYPSLIKTATSNLTIQVVPQNYSEQMSCSLINFGSLMSAFNNEPNFNVVLIHETGHVIANCTTNTLSHFTDLRDNVWTTEGALTAYSRNAPFPGCTGPGQQSEDYAEMIAYYLNPFAAEIGPCLVGSAANPYIGGAHLLHYNLAKTILGAFSGVATPPPPPPPSSGLPQFSCPVVAVGGGKNINVLPSYQLDPPKYGHCGDLYVLKDGGPCSAGTNSRRAKSVDIETCINQRPPCAINTCNSLSVNDFENVYKCGEWGKDIVMPTLDGTTVQWTYVGSIPLSAWPVSGKPGDCFDYEIRGGVPDDTLTGAGCGIGYVFTTNYAGHKYTLHLLHMHATSVDLTKPLSSGTVLGNAEAIHTHISIGVDVTDPFSQTETGWRPADKDFNICDSTNPANQNYK